MKRLICILFVFLAIMLCSCGKDYDCTIYEWPNVEYYGDENAIVLLQDYASYKDYIETISEEVIDEDFYVALNAYTEEFFEKEMLIVIVHWEGSGSIDISLKKIVYDQSNIEVVLKRDVPSICTADMKDHGIIIHVPQDDKYTTITYSVIK